MVLEDGNRRRIYLDHAAATPLMPEAQVAMRPFLGNLFGNPSAIHQEGQAARRVITECRQKVARCLQVKEETVIFTSGGTESNHLAILGAAAEAYKQGQSYADMEFVTTALEHPSVLGAFAELEARGALVHYVPVNEYGQIVLSAFQALLTERTVLVSVALVNSEIGVIADTGALTRVMKGQQCTALLHVDAAQAPLWMLVDLPRLSADVVSFDAGKCGGPKGVGMLAWQKRVRLASVVTGGGQEAGLRPGTESVLLIAGATAAFLTAQQGVTERTAAVAAVRDAGIARLREALPRLILNGPEGDDRVANNINFSLPGIDTEYAVVVLDTHGIAASTKSACSGAGGGESRVVKTISDDFARATSTIRLTLNGENTVDDIKQVIDVLKRHVVQMEKYTHLS